MYIYKRVIFTHNTGAPQMKLAGCDSQAIRKAATPDALLIFPNQNPEECKTFGARVCAVEGRFTL